MKILGFLLCCLGAAIVLFLLVSTIAAALVGSEEPCSENRFYRRLFQTWINLAIPVMRIKLDISGLELLPKDTPILYVGNHRSNFDPILAWYVLKDRPLGFVSKEGNFHIPIMGRLIRRCSCLSIDRSDPRKAIGSIYQAADILKSGISMGVYPEGTRSKGGRSAALPYRRFQDRQTGRGAHCGDRAGWLGKNSQELPLPQELCALPGGGSAECRNGCPRQRPGAWSESTGNSPFRPARNEIIHSPQGRKKAAGGADFLLGEIPCLSILQKK